MKRFIPSPAVGIAFAALFVALTGSSFAAPAREAASKLISGSKIKKNSITSAQIKNGSLASADFRKGQLPRGAKGDAGPAGPRGATGAPGTPGAPGQPGQGAPVAWARVSLDGTLAKGSGVVATRMANGGTSPGQFEVDFDRNIADCGWIAGHVGDISTPAPGGVDVDGPANTQVPQNRVAVNTRTAQGALAFQNFTVAVYC